MDWAFRRFQRIHNYKLSCALDRVVDCVVDCVVHCVVAAADAGFFFTVFLAGFFFEGFFSSGFFFAGLRSDSPDTAASDGCVDAAVVAADVISIADAGWLAAGLGFFFFDLLGAVAAGGVAGMVDGATSGNRTRARAR